MEVEDQDDRIDIDDQKVAYSRIITIWNHLGTVILVHQQMRLL